MKPRPVALSMGIYLEMQAKGQNFGYEENAIQGVFR
jgi:hypothetical protein